MTFRRGALPAVLSAALLLLAATGLAGTAEAPEITDDANDHTLLGLVPVSAAGFTSGDLVAGWIEDSGDDLLVKVQVSGTIGGGNAGGVPTTSYTIDFHATLGGTEVTAGATTTIAAITPTGAASAATANGAVLTLTIPKTAFGASVGGETLTGLYAESGVFLILEAVGSPLDRAPNSGAGTDYVISGGEPTGDVNDTDADGLNDTWELEHFGDLNQTAGDDPDNDNLTNAGEFTHGTDPNNPDTDGDGYLDGDEVTNGTDPNDPNDPDDNGTTPPPATNFDTDNDGLNDTWEQTHFGTLNQTGTDDPDNDGCDNECEETNGTDPNDPDSDGDGVNDGDEIDAGSDPLDADSKPEENQPTDSGGKDILDELEADVGYLITSGVAMLVVVTLSLIALLGRWA